jgi:hypothetical protein
LQTIAKKSYSPSFAAMPGSKGLPGKIGAGSTVVRVTEEGSLFSNTFPHEAEKIK